MFELSLGFIIFWLHIQENVNKSWLMRNAESLDLEVEESASEEDVVNGYKQKKISSLQLKKLQQVVSNSFCYLAIIILVACLNNKHVSIAI